MTVPTSVPSFQSPAHSVRPSAERASARECRPSDALETPGAGPGMMRVSVSQSAHPATTPVPSEAGTSWLNVRDSAPGTGPK